MAEAGQPGTADERGLPRAVKVALALAPPRPPDAAALLRRSMPSAPGTAALVFAAYGGLSVAFVPPPLEAVFVGLGAFAVARLLSSRRQFSEHGLAMSATVADPTGGRLTAQAPDARVDIWLVPRVWAEVVADADEVTLLYLPGRDHCYVYGAQVVVAHVDRVVPELPAARVVAR